MRQHLPQWEGVNTVAGLNLIIDQHMERGNAPDINMACSHFLENLTLPKDQLVAAMMDRARLEAVNDKEPWRLIYTLRTMEELMDREKQGKEVVSFIAQYLTDKRLTEPGDRGPEAVPRQRRRVCDGAMSALIHFMEETKLCAMYDARFGDPLGEAMWAKRDDAIRAVVKVLQENALLPADFWTAAPAPVVTPSGDSPAPTLAAQVTVTKTSSAPIAPSPQPAPDTGGMALSFWLKVVASVLVAGCLAWWLCRTRASS